MQGKIKAIIVDDELGCVANLKHYLATYCPAIEIIGTASLPQEIKSLLQLDFDIAFMDIKLQRNNVFNILSDGIRRDFDIVFVTAFEQYALRSFNVPVLDYILKPLSKKSILSCYEKILSRYAKREPVLAQSTETAAPALIRSERIVLKHNTSTYVVPFCDIIYLEAHGVYTRVHFLHSKEIVTILVSKPIGQLAQLYPNTSFFRVHYSFMINREKIKSITRKGAFQVTMCTDRIIPVSRRRTSEFCTYMNIEQ